MKTIPPLLLADLKADSTCLAFLWSITLANGRVIRGTEHDQDITIPQTGDSPADPYAGTYRAIANVTASDIASSADFSVDNLEVKGAFPDKSDSPLGYTVLDVTVDEIESGLCDQAPVVILICNWKAPSHGYFVPKAGKLGQITRTSDGNYTTEVRGLTQGLTQTIIRTFSATCNVVKFGDTRCKYNVPAVTVTGHVIGTGSIQQSQFAVELAGDSPPSNRSFVGGILTFTSGANAGFLREVKVDPVTNSGVLQTWEPFPEPIDPTDEFTLSPGCDRTQNTCQHIYDNLVNMRAPGLFIPGVNALTAGPTKTEVLGT